MEDKQNLQILIIDDEQLARLYLKETIEDLIEEDKINFKINSISHSDNLSDYFSIIEKEKINLIFLDINMPFKNGIDIIKEINVYKNKNNKKVPAVCFLTAYDNFALKAYENGAIDYLLKPIAEDKIIKFFNKLEQINLYEESKYILAQFNGIEVKINLEDIYFMKAEGKYVEVSTDKKNILVLESISKLESMSSDYIRVHRSFLVNKKFINKFFKKDNLTFVNLKNINKDIPVSRRQKSEIEGKLNIKIFD